MVPAALAGVAGPCPRCRVTITAPLNPRAQLHVAPEPAPLPLVPKLDVLPPPLPAAPIARRLLEDDVVLESARPFENADAEASIAASNFPLRAPRRGWRHLADVALLMAFTGSSLTVAAALKYAEPMPKKEGLPENLSELIQGEQAALAHRKSEASVLARAAVGKFLAAASPEEAHPFLIDALPEGAAPQALSYPMFSSVLAESLTTLDSRRVPQTERFIVTLGKSFDEGPLFVVEETAQGPRLHREPLVQQAARTFEQFTIEQHGGAATLYAYVCPCPVADEREFRAERPDLAAWTLVTVVSAFPAPPGQNAFIGCIPRESPAASQFAQRAYDSGWRQTIVNVVRKVHAESGPFVEVEGFLSNAWTRDGARMPGPPR
jgi:hypothetical protein